MKDFSLTLSQISHDKEILCAQEESRYRRALTHCGRNALF